MYLVDGSGNRLTTDSLDNLVTDASGTGVVKAFQSGGSMVFRKGRR